VRLAGIDSPELAQRPWGAYAKRYLRELISSSENSVILEFDVERRDRYRRLLAYAWTLDGKLINLEMIRNGCALLYTVSPNVRYAEVFREAQRFAREKGLGIWAGNGLREMPRSYRKGHPREPNPLSGFSP
jgi:micrococcal nuclease